MPAVAETSPPNYFSRLLQLLLIEVLQYVCGIRGRQQQLVFSEKIVAVGQGKVEIEAGFETATVVHEPLGFPEQHIYWGIRMSRVDFVVDDGPYHLEGGDLSPSLGNEVDCGQDQRRRPEEERVSAFQGEAEVLAG